MVLKRTLHFLFELIFEGFILALNKAVSELLKTFCKLVNFTFTFAGKIFICLKFSLFKAVIGKLILCSINLSTSTKIDTSPSELLINEFGFMITSCD